MTLPVKPVTFEDMTNICVGRAKISGEPESDDYTMIQGFLNEAYMTIATERNWTWKKFDRAFPFKRAVTTGTVGVTNNTRSITFSAITINNNLLGKTLNVNGDQNFYRIIGIDVAGNRALIESAYVGTTNATAQFKMYQYEFALPPDLDQIVQVYIDGQLYGSGQLDPLNILEFNRKMSRVGVFNGMPVAYCQDGNEFVAPSLPPLNETVLNYDFLGGPVYGKSQKIRLLPIEPDVDRVIHLNYSIIVPPMKEPSSQPLMPLPDRWILINFAMAEWWKTQGNTTQATMELKKYTTKLNEMRAEYTKTDPKPKFIVDGRRYSRMSGVDSTADMFWLARQNEGP